MQCPTRLAKGCGSAQFAVAWVADRPGVTSPIIGPRTMEQVKDNIGALDVEVTDADNEAIDSVIMPGQSVSPYYEADFGPHEFRI